MTADARVPSDDELRWITTRAVADIIPREELVAALKSGRALRLKMGFDPSAPDLTLGHAVGLRKLRQLQDLGHTIVVIVGDWTARIGDPSGQSKTRPMLTADEVKVNAETYLRQFSKIVDRELTEVRWQSEWFDEFTLTTVVSLAAKFTVAQMLEREDFATRFAAQKPVGIHELFYPLLQAYDSVAVQADVEFGGTDQTFNLMVGRELQPEFNQRPQSVFTVPLLVGTDGVKMSKSQGNYIALNDPPHDMYGKVMSITDPLVGEYFELLTNVPDEEVAGIREAVEKGGAGARDAKMRLAREIVSQFHGEKAAGEAEAEFRRVFSERGKPTNEMATMFIPFAKVSTALSEGKWVRISSFTSGSLDNADIRLSDDSGGRPLFIEIVPQPPRTAAEKIATNGREIGSGKVIVMSIADVIQYGLGLSRLEAKRLIMQQGVDVDGDTCSDEFCALTNGAVIRVGKHRFVRVVDAE